MAYHVYILHSASTGRYYVGFTGDDLPERLRKHNSDHKGYTGRASDWEIIYKELFVDKKQAMYGKEKLRTGKAG